MKIKEIDGFKTLVAEHDIIQRTVLGNINGEYSFIRDRYSIQVDLKLYMLQFALICLCVSVFFVSTTFFVLAGLAMVCSSAKIHVDDPLFRYCNHSYSPNVIIKGFKIICIKPILAGEEITFNYYTTESKIVEVFKDKSSGIGVE